MNAMNLFLVFCFFSTITKPQSSLVPINIKWYVEPVLSKSNLPDVKGNKNFVDMYFRFESDTPSLLALDYKDIYTPIGKRCMKESQYFWNFLNDSLKISHMFIENQDSSIISLVENIIEPSYIYEVYPISDKYDFDYSFIQLSDKQFIQERFRYSIPIISLDVCKKSNKIRLIYLQNPNKYLSGLGIDKKILISEWFDITKIK